MTEVMMMSRRGASAAAVFVALEMLPEKRRPMMFRRTISELLDIFLSSASLLGLICRYVKRNSIDVVISKCVFPKSVGFVL